MKYKCEKCGEIFSESDVVSESSSPLFNGGSCISGKCPFCGEGEQYFIEGSFCAGCGEFFPDEELYENFCSDCVLRLLSVEALFEAGEEEKELIEINGFYPAIFRTFEIEEILRKEFMSLPKRLVEKAKRNYIERDISFAAEVLKRFKRSENKEAAQKRREI